MLKENVQFGFRKMYQSLSNTMFIVLGLGLTIATVVLLYTILVTNENPNNTFTHPERMIINDNAMRYSEDSDWGSALNFRLIKEAIESIDFLEATTIYRNRNHQRWVNGERYKSTILYTDHRMEKFINFQWVQGGFFSEEDLKSESQVIMLSEKSAMNTFGTIDVVGKYCEVFDEKFRIVGVYKNIPVHTFRVDEIVPYTTDNNKDRETSIKEAAYGYSSLALVKDESDIEPARQLMHANAKKFPTKPERLTLMLFPHTIKEHLYTYRKAGPKPWGYNEAEYANYINSLILIFILSSICFVNVTNLTITNFLNRNIELGVRASFGASWTDIIKQSVIESFLYSILSFIAGLIISQVFITILNGIDLYENYVFTLTGETVLMIFLYTFAVPLVANIISNRKMLKEKPITLLKGLAA